MSYEILEHTADEKFRAVGESIEEAFSEASKAFGEIVGTDPGAGENRHSIEIEAENQEALLFDFLDRLVFIQDSNNAGVCHAEDLEVQEEYGSYTLTAEIWVDPVIKGMDLLDIKAPTYNEMKVNYKQGEGWILEAVLDI